MLLRPQKFHINKAHRKQKRRALYSTFKVSSFHGPLQLVNKSHIVVIFLVVLHVPITYQPNATASY